ncbi:MAG: PH domain-containing protein [Colwelliaceae bacterium]|nr:PH domain-containing protein [Colwelliaceae bacterium]
MLPLEPKYAATNFKLGAGFTTIFVLILVFLRLQPWLEWDETLLTVLTVVVSVLIAICLLFTIYKKLADPLKTYALREFDLSFQSGLFFRKKVTQPITRIQHIELKRGPIERKIGLATLQVFSAGGALHTFEIPGLELSKAQKIRQFILQHKDSVTHG